MNYSSGPGHFPRFRHVAHSRRSITTAASEASAESGRLIGTTFPSQGANIRSSRAMRSAQVRGLSGKSSRIMANTSASAGVACGRSIIEPSSLALKGAWQGFTRPSSGNGQGYDRSPTYKICGLFRQRNLNDFQGLRA